VLERLGAAAGWVVIGSTGLTLCVILWDWTKARSIVQSESIPQAFLSTPAFELWSLKSYAHFCFLAKIRWGRTLRQRFVMMVYFGLQGNATCPLLPMRLSARMKHRKNNKCDPHTHATLRFHALTCY
jgi:hypothetical protein